MPRSCTRRTFIKSSACALSLAAAGYGSLSDAAESVSDLQGAAAGLTLNDDGYVFLLTSDDLGVADLRRYLESYCRNGVRTVAYCVGDMSWPAHYATRVGQPWTATARQPGDLKRWRIRANVDRFSEEPGGYFGAVFRTLRELGKTGLASFRMNDAHFTTPGDPNVSEFWKAHADLTLGEPYGYYAGGFNYAHEVVRRHFTERVLEFAELYPDIDGIELDAMRTPYFFPPDQGVELAPLFTDMARTIKAGLAAQARRLNRPDYLLRVNVPMTPELALASGLDVAAWDRERLFDSVSVGAYQACLNVPFAQWKQHLSNGTPVLAYTNVAAQDGQTLSKLDYRAAAASAYGAGADGMYLFNYPCLFEYGFQTPSPIDDVNMDLPDLRDRGHSDFSTIGDMLDEIGSPDTLAGKDKRFFYYFNNNGGYRHFAPMLSELDRRTPEQTIEAELDFHEAVSAAATVTLRFKIERVLRSERFSLALNGSALSPDQVELLYVSYGRDTRTHTVTLDPYQLCVVPLRPGQLLQGRNVLSMKAEYVNPELETKISLREIEILVTYPA